MNRPSYIPFLLVLAAAAPVGAALSRNPAPVAVFNFQLTTADPNGQWRWLEKFLSDQITTDFHASGAVAVVARDRMQLLAQELGWVPEMATRDPARMQRIQKGLKITHLVSGVCGVRGEALEIVGQIVDVRTRRELYRKKLTGRTADVLTLQKRLSADLLSWFTKRPVRLILPNLPVWTRSIPAARALYEGMDLYDQGRYHEAWLKFRQSSREDPAYVEAVYWVGKMYYFMYRYDHARRALERFVYLDPFHPRLGDAMVEYLHTCEGGEVPAERLLKIYADLGRRFPGAKVWEGGMQMALARMDMDEWTRHKSAMLLAQLGRHAEALKMRYPATPAFRESTWRPFPTEQILLHHARTGEVVRQDMLRRDAYPINHAVISFPRGPRASLTGKMRKPVRLVGKRQHKLDKWATFDPDHAYDTLYLVAARGHVFKSLRCYPLVDEAAGTMELTLRTPGRGWRINPPRRVDLAEARRTGVSAGKLPRTGIVVVFCIVRVADDAGPVFFRGWRVAAEMEKVGPIGTLDVWCRDTNRYRVDVDGAFGRWHDGIVGPLAPGRHTVRLSPIDANCPYGEWTTTATVAAGEITRVAGRLPLKRGTPWSAWTVAGVEPSYPGYDLRVYKRETGVTIQADDEAVRLVWNRRGDLWSAVTRDGLRFSPPRKLHLPVSSSWLEQDPRLLRDESGRFVLFFASDREARHRTRTYLSWSRDFVHWSAPTMVGHVGTSLIQDSRGRFLCAVPAERRVWVLASREGYRWERLGSLDLGAGNRYAWSAVLRQRGRGQYELFVAGMRRGGDEKGRAFVARSVSGDARSWPAPEILERCDTMPRLAAVHAEGRSVVLAYWFSHVHGKTSSCRSVLFAEGRDGAWRRSAAAAGVLCGYASLAHHRRWGYLIAWSHPHAREGTWASRGAGPFLLRGPSLEPILGERPVPRPRTGP